MKEDAVGPNSDKLQTGKHYATKAINKDNKESWFIRQRKIFETLGDHEHIIKFYGIVIPTKSEEQDGVKPAFLFDYLETGNTDATFSRKGVYTMGNLMKKHQLIGKDGQLKISVLDLKAGLYFANIMVDGQLQEIKRLVVTK